MLLLNRINVFFIKSNKFKRNMSANNHSVKKFCKVCNDAGKSEKEYTSHYVRSMPGPNGKVICPTLLNQECKYCFKRGHTVKFCTLLEKSKKTQTVTTSSKQKIEPTKHQAPPTNVFNVLCDSDEEEHNTKVSNTTAVDEFPVLSTFEPVKTSASAFSYADALTKINKVTFVEPVVVIPAIKATTIRKKFSWLDCESSSDEEDNNELYTPVAYEDNSAW